jgi:hypothetical protein
VHRVDCGPMNDGHGGIIDMGGAHAGPAAAPTLRAKNLVRRDYDAISGMRRCTIGSARFSVGSSYGCSLYSSAIRGVA